MNVPLLQRIQRQIDKAPERFVMHTVQSSSHKCGTAFCIGGWALVLSGRESAYDPNLHPDDQGLAGASKYLGITYRQGVDKLFLMDKWPKRFQGPDDQSEEAAFRAIARIDHFIATEGRE